MCMPRPKACFRSPPSVMRFVLVQDPRTHNVCRATSIALADSSWSLPHKRSFQEPEHCVARGECSAIFIVSFFANRVSVAVVLQQHCPTVASVPRRQGARVSSAGVPLRSLSAAPRQWSWPARAARAARALVASDWRRKRRKHRRSDPVSGPRGSSFVAHATPKRLVTIGLRRSRRRQGPARTPPPTSA